MSLYRQVTEKPWNQVGLPDGIEARPTFQVPDQKVALVLFVIVACVLFSLLTVSYYLRIAWGAGDWVPVSEPATLWINTGVLVACSAVLQLSLIQARRQEAIRLTSMAGLLFVAGGLLTLVFIAGQYTAWQTLIGGGYTLQSNPANAFFYLLTGVHILHLAGGLWVWTKALFHMSSGAKAGDSRLSIELCTWYWHFLLLVWFGLFYVLSTT